MTHFRSDQHQDPHRTMNSEQRNTRSTTVKRGNGATIRCDYEPEYDIRVSEEHHNRGSEYQRVPGAQEPSPAKRQRASPSSSHSSSSRTAHRRNGRVLDKPRSSSTSKTPSKTPSKTLKMTELLSIKRELTGIKVQIDELLDCVDKMDQQRKDYTERPVGRETSPHRGSVSSVERDSPEPGEASEEEAGYYHHYNTHTYSDRISPHSLDPEDDL